MHAMSLFLAAMVAACSSHSAPPMRCGLPIALPTQEIFLAYPAPGATGVPDTVRTLIVGAPMPAFYATDTFSLTTMAGSMHVNVGKATPVPAPSPLPSPLATGEFSGTLSYFGVPIPALSPATTYTVSFQYSSEISVDPICYGNITPTLGSFTTQ
jgi:hypothetical protein